MFVASVTHQFPDPDLHTKELWKMVAYAARYGHQQMSEIMSTSSAKLTEFNEGIIFWIEKENSSGAFTRADGGG